MRGLIAVTAYAAEAPVLGWIDGVIRVLSPQVPIEAGSLATGWPRRNTTPEGLRAEIAARAALDESADPAWRGTVEHTRLGGEQARVWRLVAVGLALHGLRSIDARHQAKDITERRDIHADLVEGFLSALPRINLTRPNVERRLLDAARRQLKRGRSSRYADTPAELDWIAHPAAQPGSAPHNHTDALQDLADEATTAGRPLDALGLELIGRTVLDKQALADAAADLGLTLDAAYKRRQRTEARIAAVYRITQRRRAKGRHRTPA